MNSSASQLSVRLRRNLVILRAGDQSLYPKLRSPERNFGLMVSYYGSTDGQHRDSCTLWEYRHGPKWLGLGDILHPELIDTYEAFWLPDDSLALIRLGLAAGSVGAGGLFTPHLLHPAAGD